MGAQQGLQSPTSHYHRKEETGLQHVDLETHVRDSWCWEALTGPLEYRNLAPNFQGAAATG